MALRRTHATRLTLRTIGRTAIFAASFALGDAAPVAAETHAPSGPVSLKRVDVLDPALGDVVAGRFWAVESWRVFSAQILWQDAAVRLPKRVIGVGAPDDREGIAWPPSLSGVYLINHPSYIAQMAAYGHSIPALQGVPAPETPGAGLAGYLQSLSQSVGTRVTARSTTPIPGLQARLDADLSAAAPPEARLLYGAPQALLIDLDIVEKGVGYRGQAFVLWVPPGPGDHRPGPGGPPQVSKGWQLQILAYVYARADLFEARSPLLWALALSYRQDPRWEIASNNAVLASARQNSLGRAALHDTLQQAARDYAAVTDDMIDAHRERQSAADRSHELELQALHGVSEYETIGGERITIPTQFDHVYQSGDGEQLLLSTRPVVGRQSVGMRMLTPAIGAPGP
ncbi:MAG: hypothetical protein AAF909_08625 [Pseudomonadota bacterium]